MSPANDPAETDLSRLLQSALARTPARLMTGRAGSAYLTSTSLRLRADHAAARDAVHAEIDLARDFPRQRLLELRSQARTKAEYLMRPDRGRALDAASRELLASQPTGADVLIAVGDGLSAEAVRTQAGPLLESLTREVVAQGWTVGPLVFIRHCRVGILNDLGDLSKPRVAVLLIGERPGLATAESLSAYLAHRPTAGDTDARRNLISNIHSRGVPVPEAARRLTALIARLMAAGQSGVAIKESPPGADELPGPAESPK